MREIKFRAFNKENKKFYYSDTGTGGWWGDCVVDMPEDYEEIQQFTGLTDKNGKEIYEGDIVTTPDAVGKFYWEVKYNEKCIGYEPFACNGEGDHECNYSGVYDKYVIGNIYENPALLKI